MGWIWDVWERLWGAASMPNPEQIEWVNREMNTQLQEQAGIMSEYTHNSIIATASSLHMFQQAPNDPFRPLSSWAQSVHQDLHRQIISEYPTLPSPVSPKRSCDSSDKQLNEAIKKWEAQPKDKRAEMGP